MGLLQFGLFAILVVAIAALLIWVGQKLAPRHPEIVDNLIWVLAILAALLIWVGQKLAPRHPEIVDNLIWVLVILIIVFQLAGALGLHDVGIPRVFGR